jgi:ParB-like chromosome segregation protein Spo0J
MATTKIEKLKVVVLPIGSITLDPENARTHDARSIEEKAASLQRFGQRTPIVVRQDGVVIKGNGIVLAARSLGWDKINAVRCELVGGEAKAYAIADNRTAELSEWDVETLADILNEITDLSGTGFSQAELDELLDSVDTRPEIDLLPEEDAQPQAPSSPAAKASGKATQTARFPLSIVLTATEKAQWDRIADGRGDKETLLELIK